jgi:hypothetical protein
MPILVGDQISEAWPLIKIALRFSAAPTADTSEEKMKNILRALLTGKALCWMTGNSRKPRTVVITTMGIEEISGTKNMLIYAAHGFEKEAPKQYEEILKGIKGYAEFKGCNNILCYVWNDKIKELLESYGAECKYTLAVFPLIQ